MDDRYRITICEKLKQGKPGRHLASIDLLSFQSDKKLCVVEHLKEYLQRTKQLREEHSQLLISYVKTEFTRGPGRGDTCHLSFFN